MVRIRGQRRQCGGVEGHGAGVGQHRLVAVAQLDEVGEGAADHQPGAVASRQRIGARQQVGAAGRGSGHEVKRAAIGQDQVVAIAEDACIRAAAEDCAAVPVSDRRDIVAVENVVDRGERQRGPRRRIKGDRAAITEEARSAVAKHKRVGCGSADQQARPVARRQTVRAAKRVWRVGHAPGDHVDAPAIGDDDVVAVPDGERVGARAENGAVVAIARLHRVVAVQNVMVGSERERRAGGRVEGDPPAVAEEEVSASAKIKVVGAGAADEPPSAVTRGHTVASAEAVGGIGHLAIDEVDGSAVCDHRVVPGADGQAVRPGAKYSDIVAILSFDRVVAVPRVMTGCQGQRPAGRRVESDFSAVAEEEVSACAEIEIISAGPADEPARSVACGDAVVAAQVIGGV